MGESSLWSPGGRWRKQTQLAGAAGCRPPPQGRCPARGLAGTVGGLQRCPGDPQGPRGLSILGSRPSQLGLGVDSSWGARATGAQVPRAEGLLPQQDTCKHSTEQKCSGMEFLLFCCGFFFPFSFSIKHTHTCAATSVQRTRTQNKYMIGNSGGFTVSGASS